MRWKRRALLVGAVYVVAAFGNATTPAAALPPLKNACKLATGAEIRDLMGRRPVKRRGESSNGCVWTTRRAIFRGDRGRAAEEAGISLSGYKNAAEAKEVFRFSTRPAGGCQGDRFLRSRRLGDRAYLRCSIVTFRLGRIVGEVVTFTNDVREGSRSDVRRTVSLARKAIARLRRYRCGPPLCFR
jgi:hypothetical protein